MLQNRNIINLTKINESQKFLVNLKQVPLFLGREIILNPNFHLQLTGCYFSYIELFKYKDKLLKASKLAELEFLDVMYQMLKRIHFFNEGMIPKDVIDEAYKLTFDIDEKALEISTGLMAWMVLKEKTSNLA